MGIGFSDDQGRSAGSGMLGFGRTNPRTGRTRVAWWSTGVTRRPRGSGVRAEKTARVPRKECVHRLD